MRLAMRNVSMAAEKGSMEKFGTRKKTRERFLVSGLFIDEVHAADASLQAKPAGLAFLIATLAWKAATGKDLMRPCLFISLERTRYQQENVVVLCRRDKNVVFKAFFLAMCFAGYFG